MCLLIVTITFADEYKSSIGEIANVTRRNTSLMDEFLRNYYYDTSNIFLEDLYKYDISFFRLDFIGRAKWDNGITIYENNKNKFASTVNGFSGLLVDIYASKI